MSVLREPVFKIGIRDQTKFSFKELNEIVRDYLAYTPLHNICGTTAVSVRLHLGFQRFAARQPIRRPNGR